MIFFNRKKEKEMDHNIKIYYDIFSRKEKNLLINQMKPFLVDLGDQFPGLQSPPEMHQVYRVMGLFDPTIKICERIGIDSGKVYKMWGNYKDITVDDVNWHNHENSEDDQQLSVVYMIENPGKLGTLFKIDGEDYTFDLPTNSLVVFPSYYTHTSPITKYPRYTLALDISS
jgi:hypothetical protein